LYFSFCYALQREYIILASKQLKFLKNDERSCECFRRQSLREGPCLAARDRSGSPRLTTARAEDVVLYSAALAFYGLISVVPLVVDALWVTSLVVGPTQIDGAAAELARFSPEALGSDRAFEGGWPATAYGSCADTSPRPPSGRSRRRL
jgi:hypothetical protein